MKYSPKFFKDTMPEWKRKKDPLVARFIHRPLSFVFSSIFVELDLTPNQVSFISLLIAFVSCTLFVSSKLSVLMIAYFLLNLWSITDSADGNIARSLGGKLYGDFIDATSSYFLYGMMFLSLGYSVYKTGGMLVQQGDIFIVLAGALAGCSDTMTRLFFQKMKNNSYEIRIEKLLKGIDQEGDITDRTQSKIGRLQGRIDSEFTCGGSIHLLLLLVCLLTHSTDCYVILYLFYNGLTFLASIAYLIKKTECLKK